MKKLLTLITFCFSFSVWANTPNEWLITNPLSLVSSQTHRWGDTEWLITAPDFFQIKEEFRFNGQPYYTEKQLEQSAEAEDSLAQFILGAFYNYGIRTEGGITEKGIQLLKRAAKNNNPYANFILGQHYLKKLDYNTAIKFFTSSAQQDYGDAQNFLGVLYITGTGTSINYKEAEYWLTRAADKGVPAAQANLARIYSKGIGTPVDVKKAYMWQIASVLQSQNIVSDKDREELASQLTPEQKREANSMISACASSRKKLNCNRYQLFLICSNSERGYKDCSKL